MFSQPVLIAETDPHILDTLPRILSASMPQITIDVCTSADGLNHKLKEVSYATIAMTPLFLQDYRLVKMRKPQQLLAPLLVTAHPEHRSLAKMALESDAFDIIQSPILPSEAAQSVRVALWQNRLLRLLIAKEQAVSRFQEHLTTFPHLKEAEEQFLALFEATCQTLQTSLKLLVQIDAERALFDVAASVEQLTKQRALGKLLHLSQHSLTQ